MNSENIGQSSWIKMSEKDKLLFCTRADHEKPSKYELPAPLPGEERRGVVMPDGTLNWMCPCLGGLPYGPCGFQFREFFSCLHNIQDQDDKDSAKAQECFPKFASMKDCFSQFPTLYPPDEDDELLSKATHEATSNNNNDKKTVE